MQTSDPGCCSAERLEALGSPALDVGVQAAGRNDLRVQAGGWVGAGPGLLLADREESEPRGRALGRLFCPCTSAEFRGLQKSLPRHMFLRDGDHTSAVHIPPDQGRMLCSQLCGHVILTGCPSPWSPGPPGAHSIPPPHLLPSQLTPWWAPCGIFCYARFPRKSLVDLVFCGIPSL